MIYEIPLDLTTVTADGEVTLDVELDGSTYRLQLSYADCSQLWYLSVFLLTGSTSIPIAQGLACASDVPLFADVQVADRPVGELMFVGDRDASRDELGTFVRLRYYDAAEVAAL